LAAIKKLDSPRDLREMAAAAKMTFAKVVTDHPGTPWAMAAKLAEDELIGLEWRPAKLGE